MLIARTGMTHGGTQCRRTANQCVKCACGAYNASTGAPRKRVGDTDDTNAMRAGGVGGRGCAGAFGAGPLAAVRTAVVA